MLTLVLETRVSNGKNREDPLLLSFALHGLPHKALECCSFSSGQKKVAHTMRGLL